MTVQFGRILVLGFAALAVAMAAAADQAAQGEPAFRVESTHVDAGVVTGGQPVSATFVFLNDSDRDVRILKAAPS